MAIQGNTLQCLHKYWGAPPSRQRCVGACSVFCILCITRTQRIELRGKNFIFILLDPNIITNKGLYYFKGGGGCKTDYELWSVAWFLGLWQAIIFAMEVFYFPVCLLYSKKKIDESLKRKPVQLSTLMRRWVKTKTHLHFFSSETVQFLWTKNI